MSLKQKYFHILVITIEYIFINYKEKIIKIFYIIKTTHTQPTFIFIFTENCNTCNAQKILTRRKKLNIQLNTLFLIKQHKTNLNCI